MSKSTYKLEIIDTKPTKEMIQRAMAGEFYVVLAQHIATLPEDAADGKTYANGVDAVTKYMTIDLGANGNRAETKAKIKKACEHFRAEHLATLPQPSAQ